MSVRNTLSTVNTLRSMSGRKEAFLLTCWLIRILFLIHCYAIFTLWILDTTCPSSLKRSLFFLRTLTRHVIGSLRWYLTWSLIHILALSRSGPRHMTHCLHVGNNKSFLFEVHSWKHWGWSLSWTLRGDLARSHSPLRICSFIRTLRLFETKQNAKIYHNGLFKLVMLYMLNGI